MIAPNPDTEHEPTTACAEVHCHWHNVDETGTTTLSIICYECGHLFLDEAALQAAYAANWPECKEVHIHDPEFCLPALDAVPDADDIPFCPFCSHSF